MRIDKMSRKNTENSEQKDIKVILNDTNERRL